MSDQNETKSDAEAKAETKAEVKSPEAKKDATAEAVTEGGVVVKAAEPKPQSAIVTKLRTFEGLAQLSLDSGVPGARLDREDAGLRYIKIVGSIAKRGMYVTREKAPKCDLTGFTVDHPAVRVITEEEARKLHLGRVRGIVDFSQPEALVEEAIFLAVRKLLVPDEESIAQLSLVRPRPAPRPKAERVLVKEPRVWERKEETEATAVQTSAPDLEGALKTATHPYAKAVLAEAADRKGPKKSTVKPTPPRATADRVEKSKGKVEAKKSPKSERRSR